jgi:hypothetical protein
MRMGAARRRRQFAFTLVLSSCRAEPTQPPPPPTVIEEPAPAPVPEPPAFAWQHEFELARDAGTFAVVPRGAGLWTSPDATEPAAIFTSREHLDDGAVQVLGRVGEFVEVALDWRPAGDVAHCRPPLLGIGLRVYVRETELADVVALPTVIDLGDGTGLNVAPGVRVRASDNGIELEAIDLKPRDFGLYARVEARLPADANLPIGKIYTPGRAVPGWREPEPEHGGRILVGSDEYWDPFHMYVFARSKHDPNHVVIGGACLQLAGHFIAGSAPEPEPAKPPIAGRGGGGGTGEGTLDWPVPGSIIGKGGPMRDFPNLWEIPIGAELTWPDGSPAGTTVQKFVIQQKPTRKGARRCFVPYFDREFLPGLRFCVGAKVAQFIG